jgi:hypothetical protein
MPRCGFTAQISFKRNHHASTQTQSDLHGNRNVKEIVMAKTRPLTLSRTGMIWLIVLFVLVLIMLAFSLLPIKFAVFT